MKVCCYFALRLWISPGFSFFCAFYKHIEWIIYWSDKLQSAHIFSNLLFFFFSCPGGCGSTPVDTSHPFTVNQCHPTFAGIRARLNLRAFQYLSQIFAIILNREVTRFRIPPISECLPGPLVRNWMLCFEQTIYWGHEKKCYSGFLLKLLRKFLKLFQKNFFVRSACEKQIVRLYLII